MPTRLTVNGAKYVSRNWQRPPPLPRFVDRDGKPLDAAPIPGATPADARRPGVPVLDPDGVTYRVLPYLDPRDGWGTAEHWLKRYPVRHATLLAWVHLGILDAAMEAGSPTKRYRVRDEAKVVAYIREHPRCRVPRRRILA